MLLMMTATLPVHPRNVRGTVLLSRLEILGVEKRIMPNGKERTFLAVGDLDITLNLDLVELEKVKRNSIELKD